MLLLTLSAYHTAFVFVRFLTWSDLWVGGTLEGLQEAAAEPTLAAHSHVRPHLHLTIVGPNNILDLVCTLPIRVNCIVLPIVLSHELRMHVEAAPVVLIVRQDPLNVLIVLSGALLVLSHFLVC